MRFCAICSNSRILQLRFIQSLRFHSSAKCLVSPRCLVLLSVQSFAAFGNPASVHCNINRFGCTRRGQREGGFSFRMFIVPNRLAFTQTVGNTGKVLCLDSKGMANSNIKRPGDLPEPNDNPHPYTDFEDLEIDKYIATDEKSHKLFMDIESQIQEVKMASFVVTNRNRPK